MPRPIPQCEPFANHRPPHLPQNRRSRNLSRVAGNAPSGHRHKTTAADVAQLVEHSFRKAEVVGSSPTIGLIAEPRHSLTHP